MNAHMQELVKRFPAKLIKDDGRGNSYVPHSYIVQRLIHIYGVPPQIEVLRELYDGDKLTGVIMRLTVPGLEPVEEAGEADNPQSKTNGARAKDACSDAIKRCAMRLGLGLHLWAQENYYLDTLQEKNEEISQTTAKPSTPAPSLPTSGEGRRATPEANLHSGAAEDGNLAPKGGAGDTNAAASLSPPSEDPIEREDILRRLKEWVGGNDKRHGQVRAKVNQGCLDAEGPVPGTIADAPLKVLQAVAGELLDKESV